MADIITTLRGFFVGVNVTLILFFILICSCIVVVVYTIRKIKESKEYDVLVRIIPTHSKVEYKELKHDKEITRKTILQYFTDGTFYFNQDTGEYKIIIKDPKKTEIGVVPFKYFVPIEWKKYKYLLTLIKYSPIDYKPVKTKINYDQLKEVQNIYDTEATYVAMKTIEEVVNRYAKKSFFDKWGTMIGMAIVIIFTILAFIIIAKSQEGVVKGLQAVASSLAEIAKNLLAAASK
ncbi:MAG: hypothetical protein QW051_00215 [Candidatus Aenigmatarchaeota archaeon]